MRAAVIVGIGTDLVEITRIREAMAHSRLLEKHFSGQERAMLAKKRDPAGSAAANFAAKEAFSKALGTGVRGFSMCEVSVLRDAVGRPYIQLSGRAAQVLARVCGKREARVHVSLTDTAALAAAFVIIEVSPCQTGKKEEYETSRSLCDASE